jgi:hypothetical protein
MARRKRRPNLKLVPKAPDPILHRPPQGEYEEELIGGGHGHAKRLRRKDTDQITAAYNRGKFGDPKKRAALDRLAAANIYQRYHYLGNKSPRGCLDDTPRGGTLGLPWTVTQATAWLVLSQIEARMYRPNFIIVDKFCGEGFSLVESVRAANIVVHEDSIASRVCEALDELVKVVVSLNLSIAA